MRQLNTPIDFFPECRDHADKSLYQISRIETGELTILKVYEGYPADLVGLKPGDIITHVDGIPTENTSYHQVVNEWIKGLVGEDVVITIARFGQKDLFSVTIERRDISNMSCSKPPVNQ